MKRQNTRLLPLAMVLTAAVLGLGGLALSSGAATAGDPALLFVTSDTCMACHNSMPAADGSDVSIGTAWRASMMGNATRDPYWQAGVRREILEHPGAVAAIEHECSICHLAMSHTEEVAAGGKGTIFRHLPVGERSGRLAELAGDGVSCAACHQIREDGFGTDGSFTGGYVIAKGPSDAPRKIFGPFPVDKGLAKVMRSASGFDQTESKHVQRSELCATCHTLFTHALGADGQVVGTLAEQVPYLEWRHSSYRDSKSCQDCHMPQLAEPAAVSSVLGEPREGFSQHVFRGGNFVIPRILNQHAAELGVRATPQDLARSVERTRDYLRDAAAVLEIQEATINGTTLAIPISVTNLAGHKLPSAYPSRRVWIHLRVEDAQGQALFESGAPEVSGAIRGNDNDEDETRYEPHHRVIDRPDQVQIYEDIMAGPDGAVTTGLLTAVRYVKDNRVLPAGFDKASAPGAVAVQGDAAADPDFKDGGDQLTYRVPVSDAAAGLTIIARLLYQPIGYRWAMNLGDFDAMEPLRFLRLWEGVASTSYQVLAEAEAAVAAPIGQ